MQHSTTFRRTAATAVALLAMTAPAASARPDASQRPNAAPPGGGQAIVVTSDAAFGDEPSFGAAQPIAPPPSPAVAPSRLRGPVVGTPVTTLARHGFDWASAGAGAAALLGLLLMAAAGWALVGRARPARGDDTELPTGSVNA